MPEHPLTFLMIFRSLWGRYKKEIWWS